MRSGSKTFVAVAFIAISMASLPSAANAQSFSNPGSCYTGPDLSFSIRAQIDNCTALIASRFPTEQKAANYYGRGLLYELSGQTDLAIADFTNAIGWERGFRDAFEARGDAFADMGNLDKAAGEYAQAATLGKDNADDLDERCWVRAVRGHPLDRALADCSEALKEYPNSIAYLDSRCFVYFRMGNYPAAIADCDAAIRKQPRMDTSLYVRGLAKLRMGDVAGGNADIAAAKDANYRIADIYALYGVNP